MVQVNNIGEPFRDVANYLLTTPKSFTAREQFGDALMMTLRHIIQLSALVPMLTVPAHGVSQTFRVLVLDALSGKPQPRVQVVYFCEGVPGKSLNTPEKSVETSTDGVAAMPFECAADTRIEISLLVSNAAKEECGGVKPQKLEDILSRGFISEPNGDGNIWCPAKQRRKLSPVPGQVTVFVKKPTWYQSHVAG